MSTQSFEGASNFKPKSFWKRPEGVTGLIFLIGLIAGGGYLLFTFMPVLLQLAQNTLYLGLMIMAIAAIAYIIIDPKMRNLIGYMYKSIMRGITSLFVQIDPIGILKNYIEDLQKNLREMGKQIGALKGQMRRLKGIIDNNNRQIAQNMKLANKAKQQDQTSMVILKARKAGRLKESNLKLEDLYKKMEVLYRVLTKMYSNSEILLEDTKDQVMVKEQERKAIRASHSAMRSAMSIIAGNNDKRAMFDQAMEAIADDVANKVGEMERFMDISSNFMDSIDLQNGIFEEEGLAMLEKWEKESTSLLLGDEKTKLLLDEGSISFDLNQDIPTKEKIERTNDNNSNYNNLFE